MLQFEQAEASKWPYAIEVSVQAFRGSCKELAEQLARITNPERLADPANRDRQYLRCRMDSAGEIREEFETILNMDIIRLKECLQDDNYNAFTVLCAYVWRALKINEEINCITQFIGTAFAKAKTMRRSPDKPLYGLPFSVQSRMAVAGYPATAGLGKRVGTNEAVTCPIVQFLETQGAIPFCLTNVPQGLLSYVTSNPLHGVTHNPWDYERTPGGSSGGGAALLAAGGTAFGVGSDLGGSLRIPAAFCGLTTLKPSRTRLYTTHVYTGVRESEVMEPSSGFITRTVAEQELLLALIIGNPAYRALCPKLFPSAMITLPNPDILLDSSEELKNAPLPTDSSSLRIGVLLDDGFQNVVPSNERAVLNTIALLIQGRANIHHQFHLVKFDITKVPSYSVVRMAELSFKNAMPATVSEMNEVYKDEPSDGHMQSFRSLINWMGYFFGRLVSSVASTLFGTFYSPLISVLSSSCNSSPDIAGRNRETATFKQDLIDYMTNQQIGALICPAFITPAQKNGDHALLTTGTYLTGLFDMIDFPAGIVPVGQVWDGDISSLQGSTHFTNKASDHLVRKQLETALTTEGLPTAVQVVTLPNQEETCLRLMKLIEARTNFFVQRLKWRETEVAATDARAGVLKSLKRFERVPNQVQAPMVSRDILPAEECEIRRMLMEVRQQNAIRNQNRNLAPEQGRAPGQQAQDLVQNRDLAPEQQQVLPPLGQQRQQEQEGNIQALNQLVRQQQRLPSFARVE